MNAQKEEERGGEDGCSPLPWMTSDCVDVDGTTAKEHILWQMVAYWVSFHNWATKSI